MLKTFVAAKLHGIVVTEKSVHYNGSVSIDKYLMLVAGIQPFEKVHVVNLHTGERWETYALPDDQSGTFSLNGGGARLGEVGDPCVVMTFAQSETYAPATVVFCHEDNSIREIMSYERMYEHS